MSDAPIRLAIVGMGKMGKAVAALAPERGFDVVARLDATQTQQGITRESLNGAELAIEFTTPEAAPGNLRALADAACATVTGTTGWYEALPAIRDHVQARGTGLLYAPNFSLGVAVFARVAQAAAALLARMPAFDAHLVETHHTAKKDAPSGTALMLRDLTGKALGRDLPVTAIRTGSVPGTHELVFDAPFETIRLEHVARDRRVFAEGALTAAHWLRGRHGVFELGNMIDEAGGNT